MNRRIALLIVGPTASGKSELALRISELLECEIVSADSRQIFRYMDIGTAKPSVEERKRVVHHCIDIVDPDGYFSAGEYGKIARNIIEDILDRKKIPVVVGGSGLYIRALVEGIFEGDYRDPQLREELKKKISSCGIDEVYNELKKVDPETASRIHPNDKKRIIRALEVFMLSGQPMSKMQEERTIAANFKTLFFGLKWPREQLNKRIDLRVEKMLKWGLIDEVRRLRSMGYDLRYNSMDSVGYKELFRYLNGEISLEEAVNSIKRNTRRFAKRQMTWFRKNGRIIWIELKEPVDWHDVAVHVVESIK